MTIFKDLMAVFHPDGTLVTIAEMERLQIAVAEIVYKYAKIKSNEDQLNELQKILDVQTTHGNWDYCEYMHGVTNGLILAQSIFTHESNPKYLNAPEAFICEYSDEDHDADTITTEGSSPTTHTPDKKTKS